ncbi:DapH/DapD/GlmU-related protein, partial [Acetobacter sp.]|uniref:DapH/DapD/GlmU-related protein n=1 Tax=Acetobacter sp. TaxID=440 RepID=UPI0039ED95BF
LNFNCIVLDVAPVRMGDGTQIGPGVQILTADHPRAPELRQKMLESGRPITIGKNVWIGGGAIILPGITIGDNAIIGAGSVVTHDVVSGATVAGNPARPFRTASHPQQNT